MYMVLNEDVCKVDKNVYLNHVIINSSIATQALFHLDRKMRSGQVEPRK